MGAARVVKEQSRKRRTLGNAKWFLAATPGYLKKRRRPRVPADLKDHDCLLFGSGSTIVNLRLDRDEESTEVPVSARLLVSDFDLLYAAAVDGLGIGVLPAFRCVEDLRAHRLERVLRDWALPETPVHVVYPTVRHVSAKVKSFVDHLQQHMTPPPWEIGPLP